MSVSLEVRDLAVVLGGRPVIHSLSMLLAAGSYGVVLGPSGSGKSTLLRAIAGLVDATGVIRIGEQTVCGGRQVTPPRERGIGFLFQGLALWPHLSVDGHLAFALRGRGVPKSAHEERIRATLEPLGLAGLRDRRPNELSGGERQRLALARALVGSPRLLLLDEPTSSVDALTKRDVLDLLSKTHAATGTTVLHVTHDQDEALAMGQRIFVMDQGAVLQEGTPEDIHDRPATVTVARFIGEGGLLPAVVRDDGTAESALGSVRVEPSEVRGPAWLLVRPGHLVTGVAGDGIPVVVERATYGALGWTAAISIGEPRLQLRVAARPAPGDRIHVKPLRALRVVASRSVR